MSKLLQDILAKGGKTIRQISLPESRKPSGSKSENSYNSFRYVKDSKKMIAYGKGKSKIGLWILAFVALGALGVSLSALFVGAQILITPRKEPVIVDLNLRAVSNGTSPELVYSALPLEKIGKEIVIADGEKKVEKRASGKIIIFNNFTSSAQRLIKNTRFENLDGLIFRIESSVIVPGRTTKQGKTVPGSAEATVLADEIGTKYNIGLADFTLPAFKSDAARYAGFYARSKTPMTGGFSGMMKQVSSEKLLQAKAKIHDMLEKSLKEEALAKTPAGSVLFGDAHTVSFESLPNEELPENSVAISERASFSGFLFDSAVLSVIIARRSLPVFDDKPVTIPELPNLNFSFVGAGKINSGDAMNFSLRGNANIVWLYDKDKLRSLIIGKPKSDLKTALREFPGIVKAEAVIRPFWKRSFPDRADKIEINDFKENGR